MGMTGVVRRTIFILAFIGLCYFGLLMIISGMIQNSMSTISVGLISFIAPVGVLLLIDRYKNE